MGGDAAQAAPGAAKSLISAKELACQASVCRMSSYVSGGSAPKVVSNFTNRHRSKFLNRLPNIPIEATVGNIRLATEPQTSNERSLNDFLTFSII